ncbi:hypothetical protein GUJ93_ZPchr0001g32152 [Zizania palustris]|uniref:Uncharacterized protein n=1 Tax=Zizania palustris TaxID=103762 RepID=A0A8J5S985_ZIZPA|nr:hypothetical protein GUJ93_ZPchr0001g32152 [Zizania palustris]
MSAWDSPVDWFSASGWQTSVAEASHIERRVVLKGRVKRSTLEKQSSVLDFFPIGKFSVTALQLHAARGKQQGFVFSLSPAVARAGVVISLAWAA